MALSEEERKEKAKARSTAWYEANSEKAKARDKARYEANPEKANARNKAWYEANAEKAKALNKAYREANPEKAKARDKARYEANTEKIILQSLKSKDITDPPEELIELMVARREAKRTLKKMKKWRKENDPTITDVQGIEHQNEIPDGLP